MGRGYFSKKAILVGFLIILSIGIYYSFLAKDSHEFEKKTYGIFPEYEEERLALEGFIDKYFIEDGFFRTNLLDSKQGEIASGKDILSESVGLLMLYYFERDEPEKFNTQVKILKGHFINKNGLVKWRIRREINRETVNATIDDLRIVKALIMAAEEWGRDDYQVLAEGLSIQLLRYCVIEDSLKAYDSPDGPEAPFVYYDFKAMELMKQFDNDWSRLAAKNKENILKHQVKGLPFFKDKWFSEEKGFPTVENLLIMMHLAEIGIKDAQSLIWLKIQLKQQGLYSSYSIAGKSLDNVESPAIYAIAARIARFNNDEELYYLAIKKLKNMQNLENNQYYGGFIDLKRLSTFSFDQLLSLLAY